MLKTGKAAQQKEKLEQIIEIYKSHRNRWTSEAFDSGLGTVIAGSLIAEELKKLTEAVEQINPKLMGPR